MFGCWLVFRDDMTKQCIILNWPLQRTTGRLYFSWEWCILMASTVSPIWWEYFAVCGHFFHLFYFHCESSVLVGQWEGHPVCKKLGVALLLWQFDKSLIAPVFTITSIVLSSNKVQNEEPGWPGKRLLNEWRVRAWWTSTHVHENAFVFISQPVVMTVMMGTTHVSHYNWYWPLLNDVSTCELFLVLTNPAVLLSQPTYKFTETYTKTLIACYLRIIQSFNMCVTCQYNSSQMSSRSAPLMLQLYGTREIR